MKRTLLAIAAVAIIVGVPAILIWQWYGVTHNPMPRSEEELRGVEMCDFFSSPFKPVRWIDGTSRQKCTARKDGECFDGSRAGSVYYACPESEMLFEVVLPPGTWLVGSGMFTNKCHAEWLKPGEFLCTAEKAEEHRKREEKHGK